MSSLLAALIAPIALSGRAEPSPLHWDALEGCPAPTEVADRLRALTGPRALDLRAEATVRPHPSGWEVRLAIRWRGQLDERVLVAPDCDTLAETTALLVAVMADPLEVAHQTGAPRPREPPASGAAGGGPAPSTSTPTPRRRSSPSRPERRPEPQGPARARARAGLPGGPSIEPAVRIDAGSLPRLAAGPSLTFAWRWSRLAVLAEGLYLPPRSVDSSLPSATSARVQLGALRLGACARLGEAWLEAPLCVLAEGGGLWASRFGPEADLQALDPWGGAGAAGGLVIPLGRRLALSLRLEALVPLARRQYRFAGVRLFETAPLVVRGGLGLEVRWDSRISARAENTSSE